jgi:hypothetical protein
MNKDFSGSHLVGRPGAAASDEGGPEPLGISPGQTAIVLNCGVTYVYKLMNTGELEFYFEGKFRKITTESIRRRHARKLAEARAGVGPKRREFWPKRAKAADDVETNVAPVAKPEPAKPKNDAPADNRTPKAREAH